MASSYALTLLPGARELLAAHARELPQRDELCGAFCGALALRAAGLHERGGEPLDQDAVALAAGTVLAREPDPGHLPPGARGRRDYRVALALVEDPTLSGTTAAGLVRALAELSGGALAAVPFSGPWTAATMDGLFDALAELERPATLIANLATGRLWGSHAEVSAVLEYLAGGAGVDGEEEDGDVAGGGVVGGDEADEDGEDRDGGPRGGGESWDGPPPDWEVGHFVCLFGRLRGPRGVLYGVADTYPALGWGGVHLQPAERLAAALERRDMPAGGMVAVVDAQDADRVRARARAAGLREGVWDNGTLAVGAPG